MTIDEAITREKEMAKEQKTKYDKCPTRMKYCCEMCFHNPKCNEVAEYNEQLAEWLEELKCYKNDNDFSDYADRLHKIAFNSGYNKALDDFVNTVKATFPHDNIAICNTEVIAEQLKEGEQND